MNISEVDDQAQDTVSAVVTSVESPSPPRFVPPAAGAVDILRLLTDLEDQIESTSRGPFGTLFRFDEDKFHVTVMKIRANLPEDLKRASRLAREMEVTSEEAKEQVERALADGKQGARAELERARAEAAQIRDRAQGTAANLQKEASETSQTIVLQAEQHAANIHQETELEAQRIIEEARKTGFGMLEAAQTQAQKAIAESEILRQAQAKAHEILTAAEQQAAAVRNGADEYARDVLTNLETVLGKAMCQIEQGRSVLDRR